MQPVLAHGSGIDDIGIFVVGALLVGGYLLTVRRMRQMEAQEQTGRADVRLPGADVDSDGMAQP
jgi:hypothetical protein